MGYRRRSSYKRNYGLEAAKRHIADAHAFSVEVGRTDEVVKAAFFSLPRASLNDLFTRYGDIYGEDPADNGRETFPKWKKFWQQQRSGGYHRWTPDAVQMSGTVAERLFALLPPLLPTREKHKIVEAIWKAYGPRSRRYVYLGPDSNPESVVAAIGDHFANQNVQYAIPRNLEERFDWLSDNDVTVKQQLLNYFMDEQRKAAIASARLNIPMMMEQMTGESAAQISKLSHTVFVGNHLVEIKADPRRTGYLLSNSPDDGIRPPVKVPWAGLGITAAIIGGLFVIVGELNHPTSSPQRQQSVTQTYQQPVQQPPPISATSPPHLAPMPLATDAALPQPVRTQGSLAAPAAAPSSSTSIAAERAPVNGCGIFQIASVSGDGSEVIISNGNRYAIADDLMKVTASNWATGDSVVVCSTADGTSLKVGYSSAQASGAGSTLVEAGSCRRLYIGYSAPDGSDVGTTDGSVFHVVENDLLKVTASNWTTGQPATVCTARHNGTWYASVRVGYSKTQTTMATIGSGQTVEPSCSDSMVDGSGSGRLRIGGGSYRVDNDLMQVTAQQFETGDPVVVCKYSSDGITHASIARGYSRVQATEL